MPISNITYEEMRTIVVSYIATNCNNVDESGSTKYDAIPECFKPNYSVDKTIPNTAGGSRGDDYKPIATATISANAVGPILTQTVSSDFDSFLQSLGITDRSINVPVSDFTNIFNNILSFCSAHVKFVTSQKSTKKLLVYYTNVNPTKYTKAGTDDIIYAKSANDILNVLKNEMNTVIRSISIQYTYSFV